MNSMKRQKDTTLKEETPSSVGAQYATGGEWRNNSRKNKETKSKQNLQSYSIANNLHYFLFVRKHKNNVEWNTKFT